MNFNYKHILNYKTITVDPPARNSLGQNGWTKLLLQLQHKIYMFNLHYRLWQ